MRKSDDERNIHRQTVGKGNKISIKINILCNTLDFNDIINMGNFIEISSDFATFSTHQYDSQRSKSDALNDADGQLRIIYNLFLSQNDAKPLSVHIENDGEQNPQRKS